MSAANAGGQVHVAVAVLVGPVKLKVALGQSLPGTKMVTWALCPGVTVPLDGVKITPDNPVLADQLRAPWEPAAGVRRAVQVQPALEPALGQLVPPIKLDGLTVNMDVPVQFHATGTLFAGPTKLKVAVAGQVVFVGIETVTCTVCSGISVPLDGLKVIPFIPLLDAFQLRFP